jgi:F-type H+-transporting ATPase subunit gamma
VSSDRGLCGGVHSSISKATKKFLAANAGASCAIVGQKARAQLAREYRRRIVMTFDQVAKAQATWREAALVTDELYAAKALDVDSGRIFYNAFKSVIAFETTALPTYSLKAIEASPKLAVYEADSGVLKSFEEFSLANALFWTIAEGGASEVAARRTAMENATKNAGEMINKLQLTYNRSRQASITNDLIDIITGASAM